jgi:AraC family transcriptional regulator
VSAPFATVTETDGVAMTYADVNGFTVGELRFPPDYMQAEFEPERPYLALVVEGGVEKSFPLRTMHLSQACAVTMPAGARHGARFARDGARIVIIRAKDASSAVAGRLDRLTELRGHGFCWLAWKLAAELYAPDAAAPLAAEGIALELLAAASREAGAERTSRTPRWLREAEDVLRSQLGDRIGLAELARTVGVHPTHLAREFRARCGVSVGEYGRRVRLARAAAEIARTDAPLAEIAAEAGFADQSHFTRLFKRHAGVTPGSYREQTQRAFHSR